METQTPTKNPVYCTMNVKRYTLKPGTKTAWVLQEDKTAPYTEQQYRNTVEATPFFRNLGGSEHLTRAYTSKGYLVVQIISKSPDRQTKVVRTFDFDSHPIWL